MKYQVNITEIAERDLRSIYEHIAYTLGSKINAAGQLKRLKEEIFSLETMPESYRAYEKEPWHSRGLRVMPVDNYVVFYIPYAENFSAGFYQPQDHQKCGSAADVPHRKSP